MELGYCTGIAGWWLSELELGGLLGGTQSLQVMAAVPIDFCSFVLNPKSRVSPIYIAFNARALVNRHFEENMTNDWEVTIGDAKDTEARYGHRSNRISTTKYSILTFLPKNLFEQFHRAANIFFLFMAVIALIPATQALNPETAAAPLLTVLLVTAIRDGLGASL